MKGGPCNSGSAHEDRFQIRHRREFSRTSHLDFDGYEPRLGTLGLIFEGHSPARRLGSVADAFPEIISINLDDSAVDLERKIMAYLAQGLNCTDHLLHRL